ncbi:Aste57867_24695 [Aphanomyces stellatus]|uniref:Aste57867_24695 protein n=1 Tax=Aphanomyces stellatus TaxID=120398 RepID=A0A485LR44_9STRA|nr:hypothetical protein As57867_024617 [Aphanomyces stellatus]VFU01332.1 Aste57867_24695 [Aphanomyces stellatus]
MAESTSPHYVDISLTPSVAEALIRVKLPSFDTVVLVEDINVGYNNRCFSLTTALGHAYVLRLTKDTWPAAKIIAEAASLAALAHYKVDIPVPGLVAYNADANPDLHVRWMLMEKMTGTMLETVWETAPPAMRAHIAAQVEAIHTTLQSHRFNQIGGWVFDGTTPVLGKFFDGVGPYADEREWLTAAFEDAIAVAMSKPALESLGHLVPRATAAMDAYLAALSPCPIVLFHGDFAFRNMLVDEEGTITAILDWEWCGAMPLWKEWTCVSFGDHHVYDFVPSFKYPLDPTQLESRKHVDLMIHAFAPWQLGLESPEKDQELAVASHATIEASLAFLAKGNQSA